MNHHFDTNIATKYGVNCAILLQTIHFWVFKNECNDTNYYDGHYWTRNKSEAFLKQFPYLSSKQIRTALNKLEKEELIITGNYNATAYDRTKWYALTEKGYALFQEEDEKEEKSNLPKGQMENSGKDNTIQYNKKNNDTNIKKPLSEKEGGGATKKKSYRDIFTDPQYESVSDALKKYVHSLKALNYTPRTATVESWALFLLTQSHGNPVLADRIVKQSIDRGWKKLLPLKDSNNVAVSDPYNPDDLARDDSGEYIVY